MLDDAEGAFFCFAVVGDDSVAVWGESGVEFGSGWGADGLGDEHVGEFDSLGGEFVDVGGGVWVL